VSVSGTVETKTSPDQVVWRIDLTDTDEDMREAKARNDEKVASVLALREKLGIEEGEIETGAYHRGEFGERPESTWMGNE
jgi:uncharacterized protein YggE